MRAAVFHEIGDNVTIDLRDDVNVEGPGPDEVRVKIHVAGVCHSDLSGMNGTLPQPAPAVPGHEGAGDVIAVGEGVTDVAVGDRVIVVWQPPCGDCHYCLTGRGNLCVNILFAMAGVTHFTIGETAVYGLAGTGTMAEEMVLPHQAVVKMPDDVSYE